MRKLKKIFIAIVLGLIFVNPVLVVAQSNSNANTSAPAGTATSSGVDVPEYTGVQQSITDFLCTPSEETDGRDLERCINKLYRFGISFGAIALVFFIVFAGYMYIAGGESGKGKAKEIVQNSIVGIMILLGSYVLLRFINPNLVIVKPIQPPIFTAEDLPTCAELGFGESCTVAVGENSGSDAPSSGGGSCRGGLTCGGSVFNNFPRYAQGASPWGSMSYGCGTDVKTSGCGPASMAQVLTFYKSKGKLVIDPKVKARYGDRTTPQEIAPLALSHGLRVCGSGSAHALPAVIAKDYGLTSKAVGWAEAEAALRKDIPVIATMRAGSPFTDGGHFITLVAIRGDTVYFADTGPRNVTSGPIAITRSSATSLHIIQ